MDVSGFLKSKSLFAKDAPQGVLKWTVGRLLHTVNAAARGYPIHQFQEEFYALKGRILAKYGQVDGTDWQEIVRSCHGCDDCGGWSRYDGWSCGGTKVYSRKFIPLARHRLGAFVFHTPGIAVQQLPPGESVKFKGLVPHAKVDGDDAARAFLQLCLLFDVPLFKRAVIPLMNLEGWLPF